MKVQSIRMSRCMLDAIACGQKLRTRRLVTAANSTVEPGSFENLLLDFGRMQFMLVNSPRWQIRAPCSMPAGNRVVAVDSVIQPGDLLWVRCGQQGRFACRVGSEWTLEVLEAKPFRIRDIGDYSAATGGFAGVDEYHAYWRRHLGAKLYLRNPWVWEYLFRPINQNIDAYLELKSK